MTKPNTISNVLLHSSESCGQNKMTLTMFACLISRPRYKVASFTFATTEIYADL